MVKKYIFTFMAFGLLMSCANANTDTVVIEEDSLFEIDRSYTPNDWHRYHHGPDRFFYRYHAFRDPGSMDNDNVLVW